MKPVLLERTKPKMKIKCTSYRLVDGKRCSAPAKYEVKFEGRHIGFVCGTHARSYTKKALFPLEVSGE